MKLPKWVTSESVRAFNFFCLRYPTDWLEARPSPDLLSKSLYPRSSSSSSSSSFFSSSPTATPSLINPYMSVTLSYVLRLPSSSWWLLWEFWPVPPFSAYSILCFSTYWAISLNYLKSSSSLMKRNMRSKSDSFLSNALTLSSSLFLSSAFFCAGSSIIISLTSSISP